MQQDWIWGLLGGGLIGLGAAVYLLGLGRIMGASGIIGGLVDGTGRSTAAERLAFLAGVVLLPVILTPLYGVAIDTHITGNWLVIVAAGLLVGIGTRIANGCTSGHGVCGISRFSLRGIVATVFYILAGGLTLAVLRHVLGVI
ncbi:YeeE/YedE family protein [Sedimentitalea sp. HM32M-2]|uniref:YeeE/YedE family protein n=1 Tax=Sedimentitalea sp. HM32M-2 TaxID=3351566 RepID=UPI00363005F2